MKHNTLKLLPRELARFSPEPRPGLRFGIPALDALLPLGVPRGHITALDAPLGSGGTAVLLALAEATLQADEAVTLIDAQRTLAPQSAAHLAALGSFWVIRPRGSESAWWCADVLLRTGAFGLVIVDLAPAPARKIAVRLQRIARDKDTALVVREAGEKPVVRLNGPPDPERERGEREAGARSRSDLGHRRADGRKMQYGPSVRLSVRPSITDSIIRVTIDKGGAPRTAEVSLVAPLPHRLRPHWEVRDRRGAAGGAGKRSISGRGQRPRAGTPHWPE
jgi:recombination protein RecA